MGSPTKKIFGRGHCTALKVGTRCCAKHTPEIGTTISRNKATTASQQLGPERGKCYVDLNATCRGVDSTLASYNIEGNLAPPFVQASTVPPWKCWDVGV